uniref:Uncharacterized protein n=1 Tax=Anguilla anguilla TaxID=7936 RepID=A0A0E9WYA8_ANGAN
MWGVFVCLFFVFLQVLDLPCLAIFKLQIAISFLKTMDFSLKVLRIPVNGN